MYWVYDKFGPRRLLFGTGMVGATRRIPLADELRLVREDIRSLPIATKGVSWGGTRCRSGSGAAE